LTLAITTLSGWVFGMRNNMINTLGEDYVTFAEANGLRTRTIALLYAARNAILPNVTAFGLSLGAVVGGSVLVEGVFSYPGLGNSALHRRVQPRLPVDAGAIPRHHREHAGRDLCRRSPVRPFGSPGTTIMSIVTSVPPPTVPGAGVQIPLGRPSSVPGPFQFIGRSLRTLWANGKARIGLVILGLDILVALLAPLIAPHSPTATTFPPYLSPNATNWFGTTGNGQDVFSQMIYGARISLLVGIIAGAVATFVAVTIGLIAGYRPGIVDEVLSFATNLALVIPGLPLMFISGCVPEEPLRVDHRPGRRVHQLGHGRPRDPQPGLHAAHPRVRDLGTVLR